MMEIEASEASDGAGLSEKMIFISKTASRVTI